MQINLSKYPPGTKFKLKNGLVITLIGKSTVTENRYILEFNNGQLTQRFKDGTHFALFDYDIESVIQPDKYLVAYCRKNGTIDTTIVISPAKVTYDCFFSMCCKNDSRFGLENTVDKVLSWTKIE